MSSFLTVSLVFGVLAVFSWFFGSKLVCSELFLASETTGAGLGASESGILVFKLVSGVLFSMLVGAVLIASADSVVFESVDGTVSVAALFAVSFGVESVDASVFAA